MQCSLNCICTSLGKCVCDKPWGGPGCGVLQYKMNQPVSAKDLYPFNNTAGPLQPCVTPTSSCDALNTWNGPIIGPVGGKYHMYNPLYKKGSLLATSAMLHGVAANITGPYTWESWPNMGSNPAAVAYTEGGATTTTYALFTGGGIRVSSSPDGPFDAESDIGRGPGGNPAPIYHDGVWYATSQRTTEVVMTPKLGQKWTHFANIVPKLSSGTQEDPFMYIDKKGNWHIINHAYDTSEWKNCGNSTLSAHVFSRDGKDWHMLKPDVHPYTHEVHYEDGTTHSYSTLERPNLHFTAEVRAIKPPPR
jgi:hypothetical protein